jgi:hypothetical protein
MPQFIPRHRIGTKLVQSRDEAREAATKRPNA